MSNPLSPLVFASIFIGIMTVVTFECAAAEPKNESDIKVVGESNNKNEHPFVPKGTTNPYKICLGTVPSNVDLTGAGLTTQKLKTGVVCLVNDYDNNGYVDFILYGPEKIVHAQNFTSALVLFFSGKSIVRSQVIQPAFELTPFEVSDPERKNYSQHAKSQGLINRSHGNRDSVFFFDSTSGLFKQVPWVPFNVDPNE